MGHVRIPSLVPHIILLTYSAVLMSVITRKCYRKQGAASMLIRWGVEQAKKDGIPAYLEASVQGKPVYERCGFRQVGESVPWDCKVDGQHTVFNIAKMAWYPHNHHEPLPQTAQSMHV